MEETQSHRKQKQIRETGYLWKVHPGDWESHMRNQRKGKEWFLLEYVVAVRKS